MLFTSYYCYTWFKLVNITKDGLHVYVVTSWILWSQLGIGSIENSTLWLFQHSHSNHCHDIALKCFIIINGAHAASLNMYAIRNCSSIWYEISMNRQVSIAASRWYNIYNHCNFFYNIIIYIYIYIIGAGIGEAVGANSPHKK